ncbi:hypothetical protein JK635_07455 [Neobacillus sp. YIM B02564]|uniref:Replication protein n=1 Tax=Neobacillus paridis TaxID=2803862 RepID=A0ABS1TL64_9BACI|nr:hypothetical protein [Neobacillus paridis]MBL4952045.1 hypothetical protein [Neobacillus paridis]
MNALSLESSVCLSPETKIQIDRALSHLVFHHPESQYICLFKKHPGEYEIDRFGRKKQKVTQTHFLLQDLLHQPSLLAPFVGEDAYFSMNDYFKIRYKNGIERIDRTQNHIHRARALYVDIDFHSLTQYHLAPELFLEYLKEEIERLTDGDVLPEPNYMIWSGRGVNLVWLLQPVSESGFPYWRALEEYFITQFDYLGADAKVKDLPRVMRLDGGINSKNGVEVRTDYRHEKRYDMDNLLKKCLPDLYEKRQHLREVAHIIVGRAEKKKKRKPKKRKPEPLRHGKKGTVTRFRGSTNQLNLFRAKDLEKLSEMRKGKVTGNRDLILFLYCLHLTRYYTGRMKAEKKILNPEDKETAFQRAFQKTLLLNQTFTFPMSEKEITTNMQSVLTTSLNEDSPLYQKQAKEKGYRLAGYYYSNERIIKELNITPEEQQTLYTIISKSEKERRNPPEVIRKKDKDRKKTARQKAKIVSREEKRQRDIELLRETLKAYPGASQRALQKLTHLSASRVNSLLKELKTGKY